MRSICSESSWRSLYARTARGSNTSPWLPRTATGVPSIHTVLRPSLRFTKPVTAEDCPGAGAAVGSVSPRRMLAVLLGEAAGFALAARNSELIPQLDLTSHEDPLADGELIARTGGFEIKLGLHSEVGSYLSAVVRYQFEYQGVCLRLIAYDRLETHRAVQTHHPGQTHRQRHQYCSE